MALSKTTEIDYCTGIHETGMPMVQHMTITTELPEDYADCPETEQRGVLDALHAYEVARAEAEDRLHRAGHSSASVKDLAEACSDALFDAARESAENFIWEYERATRAMEAI